MNKKKSVAPEDVARPKRPRRICRLCGGDGKRAEETFNKETGEYEVRLVTCFCKEDK